MLRSVNWGEKLGQMFGGHLGRVFKVCIIFGCALTILLGLYRVRTTRINKEETTKRQLKSTSAHPPIASVDKWVIVANPDDYSLHSEPDGYSEQGYRTGSDYVCTAAAVSGNAGWKTVIIGPPLPCCTKPDCYSIEKSQFLRMQYRTASVIRHLMGHGGNAEPYKETIRNLAFIWALHRGARYIFDAYVDEYMTAGVHITTFADELARQLKTLALDESLALVEERGRSRVSNFKSNPYSHFGRPDVRLLPSGPGMSSGSKSHHSHSHQFGHPVYSHYNSNGLPSSSSSTMKLHDFPSYRICEVRPPSIEKFLEIDEGWWDLRAPPLVLPGDTMPPLCTRNTLFSPEVFWALPLLPDYSLDDEVVSPDVPANNSRIPPWYIRGLWSQSLLGDLGGSIRLSLSRVPTLQLNQDFFVGGAYEPNIPQTNSNKSRSSSRLLKRWNCRSKSTFRCLLLMSKELAKSVYMGKDDLTLIEAWIVDLRSIHYTEPRMLPKRRSHTNPCLGADGLHGVSFHPALEPKYELSTEDYVSRRNESLKEIITKIQEDEEKQAESESKGREKRETERPSMVLPLTLVPPSENATYTSVDWSAHVSDYNPDDDKHDSDQAATTINGAGTTTTESTDDSYFPQGHESLEDYRRTKDFMYTADELLSPDRSIPIPNLDNPGRQVVNGSPGATRTGKHFRAFLQQIAAQGHPANEFPILKAMADNLCPGYGQLLPYQPQHVHSDILLIVAFTSHHYDLIPTFEVMYRSSYPNILYCGYPHESVEIFLRKYQTVEHRSFSFLPTYTRSTYECVLGAIEMNYEVNGYMVITDETLLASMNINDLDREKLWVSSSGFDKVTRGSWERIDPGGQKLPRLIDGITSTWKLFSYILLGQDSVPFLEGQTKSTIKKRSLDAEEKENVEKESLETEETAYLHQTPNFRWGLNSPLAINNNNGSGQAGDLQVSDWDYAKGHESPPPTIFHFNSSVEPEVNGTGEEGTEEVVLIGEEEDENSPPDSNMSDIMVGLKLMEDELNSSSPIPLEFDEMMAKDPDVNTPVVDDLPTENSTTSSSNSDLWPASSSSASGASGDETSSTVSTNNDHSTESALGVPLYHVEHVEPPTPPKWHKPEEMPESSSTEKDLLEPMIETSSENPKNSNLTEHIETITHSSTRPTIESSTPPGVEQDTNADLKNFMETILTNLHEAYANLIAVVGEYEENNTDDRDADSHIQRIHEYSAEVPDPHLIDSTSHRISPREFRHIRCTTVDDGHQSELCSTLRDYVAILGQNNGRDIRLFYDTIPMYYLPSHSIRSFYSIANVLLHYGVMDELALPIVFRGLDLESNWIHLNKSTELNDLELLDSSKNHYFYPFSLHKVFGNAEKRKKFCSKYLLQNFLL